MTSNHSFRWQAHWDKIIFTLASLYFLSVLGWLVRQNKVKIPFITSQVIETQTNPLSDDDKAFIAYLKARLATIDTTQSKPVPLSSSPTLQGNLPTVAVSPPPPPKPNPPQPQPTSPSVIERIYIPVYPENPQETVYSPPVVAPAPPIPAPPPATIESVPVLTPGANLLPSETALAPPSENKLVGTLPSGDRSYAIFKLEGKAHHVRIGQFVGPSGWILVDVEDQFITLQKNGKQRRMSVGSQLFQ
ncbi:MAG: hypothetical protein AB4058_11545 [Microcystaceae cyanobacterium]